MAAALPPAPTPGACDEQRVALLCLFSSSLLLPPPWNPRFVRCNTAVAAPLGDARRADVGAGHAAAEPRLGAQRVAPGLRACKKAAARVAGQVGRARAMSATADTARSQSRSPSCSRWHLSRASPKPSPQPSPKHAGTPPRAVQVGPPREDDTDIVVKRLKDAYGYARKPAHLPAGFRV